ncbi:MAG: DMT family transporter [Rhodospirillales bacterium]
MSKIIKSQYAAGVCLIVVSALAFSTAGLFSKGVSTAAWDIIFWRGVFAAGFTTAWTFGRGAFRSEFFKMGRSGLAAAVVSALGTAAFISAFKLTSVANVSLIYAAAPLIAAVLAWIWIGEKITLRVAAGCAGALAGVGIIVHGSVGQLNLTGDLLALWMTSAMALLMVIYRKYPETPGAGPAALSSLLLLPPAAVLGAPFAAAPHEIAVMAAFGLIFAVASMTLAEGAKRVPSGQTALLSALETPLAPALAFLVLAEVPPSATFIGGAMVCAAVVASIQSRKA